MDAGIFNQFLSQLDPNIVKVCVAVLIVAFILSLAKKAVKLAIVVLVIAVACGGLIPKVTEFQKNYGVHTSNNGALIVTVDGKQFKFGDERGDSDRNQIKDIEMVKESNGDYTVIINYADKHNENTGNYTFSVPYFMKEPIKEYIDKYNYILSIRE